MPTIETSRFQFADGNLFRATLKRALCHLACHIFAKPPVHLEFHPEELKRPTIFIFEATSLVDYALLAHYLHQQGCPTPLYLDRPITTPTDAASHSVCLPLEKPATLLSSGGATPQFEHFLRQLATSSNDASTTHLLGYQIVPILFLWSKLPEHYLPSWLDRCFGTSIAPGYLRKLFHLMINRRNVVLHIGNPVDTGELIKALNESKAEVSLQRIKKHLSRSLANLRRMATGPLQKWKSRIVELVVRDEDLIKTMQLLAKREETTYAEQQERTREILDELAADYSVTHTSFLGWCLQRIYNLLFDDFHIDAEGFAEVRRVAAKGKPLILLPTHKSHMDYLIISKIFFSQGMHPPHIAAGVNLAFWPMGYFFRKAGAFFIRRKIQGDLLYARTLEAYIRRLIKEGYNQEFFIEGGRSRDGKLIDPKLGILGITVDAYFEHAADDIFFIPINITYDKVLEDKSYARENVGAPKEKESIWQMLRTFKNIGHSFGDVHVQFGTPISVKALEKNIQESSAKSTKKLVVKTLTDQVVQSLNKLQTITPQSLLAMALLRSRDSSFNKIEITRTAQRLLSVLRDQKVFLSPRLRSLPSAIDATLLQFKKFKIVRHAPNNDNDYFTLNEEDRLLLAYYKNLSIHHYLAEGLVALTLATLSENTISSPLAMSQIEKRFALLVQLLANEFVELQNSQRSQTELLQRGLNYYAHSGFVEIHPDNITLKGWHLCDTAAILRELFMPYLESIWAVVDFMVQNQHYESLPPQAALLLQNWQNLKKEQRLKFNESGNVVSLNNAYLALLSTLPSQNSQVAFNKEAHFTTLLQQIQHWLEERPLRIVP